MAMNQDPILNIRPFVSRMRHFAASTQYRLPGGKASLSRPTVHQNERHLVMGAEHGDGTRSVVLLDTGVLEQNMLADPIVSRLSLPSALITSQWIGRDRLLAFTGVKEESPTTMSIYRVDVEGKGEFKLEDSLIINDTVREIETSPTQAHLGVYGGAENKLNLCDFNAGLQPTRTFLTDSGVSSVRWGGFHDGAVISATTEEGQVHLFDLRTPKDASAWTYKSDLAVHKALYSHCQVTDFQLILGFEDNFMEAIDIRMPQNGLNNHMTGAFDPFCHMIGDMHYREGFLLVSGMADFAVYKHHRSGEHKNVAQLWSHSVGSQNSWQNESKTVFNCAFLRDSWVLCAADESLNIYKLE